MKEVFLVFNGDAWLSTGSLVLTGVYSDFKKAILDILEDLSENGQLDGENTRDSIAKELSREHQTQGFDTNYIIKTANLNEWGEI